jgi:hypothetical protein
MRRYDDAALMPFLRGQRGASPAPCAGLQAQQLMRTLEDERAVSLTSLREKLIKIGAKVVSHRRHFTFQMTEVAVSQQTFADMLSLIAQLRAPSAPA